LNAPRSEIKDHRAKVPETKPAATRPEVATASASRVGAGNRPAPESERGAADRAAITARFAF
jgi:hypothetical protein